METKDALAQGNFVKATQLWNEAEGVVEMVSCWGRSW